MIVEWSKGGVVIKDNKGRETGRLDLAELKGRQLNKGEKIEMVKPRLRYPGGSFAAADDQAVVGVRVEEEMGIA